MKPSVLLPACELLWAAPGCFQERKSFASGWYTLRCHLAPSLRSVDKTVEKILRINTVEIAEPGVWKVQLTFLTRMERSWTKSLRRLWRVWSSRAFDITGEARRRGNRTFKIMSAVIGALLDSERAKWSVNIILPQFLPVLWGPALTAHVAHGDICKRTGRWSVQQIEEVPKRCISSHLWDKECNNLRCPECKQLSA